MKFLEVLGVLGIGLCISIAGCQSIPTNTTPPKAVVQPQPTPTPSTSRIALWWENTTEPHPERAAWSDYMTGVIRQNLAGYGAATDITRICPKWETVSDDVKVKAIGNFWVSVALYESSFDPNSQDVDVGTQSDKNSWSIGLWQMSQVDQKNYGLSFNYTFDQLLTPSANFDLANAVMLKQIKNHGKIVLKKGADKGVYWATVFEGGAYDQSANVLAHIQKYTTECF
jgi:hypothetical protein